MPKHMQWAIAVVSMATWSGSASLGVAQEPHGGPLDGNAVQGLPAERWRSSPYHGVVNPATGQPIPCRCRFGGIAYRLGTIVCMSTHVGVVLARCDLLDNITTWVPSREPCTISDVGPAAPAAPADATQSSASTGKIRTRAGSTAIATSLPRAGASLSRTIAFSGTSKP